MTTGTGAPEAAAEHVLDRRAERRWRRTLAVLAWVERRAGLPVGHRPRRLALTPQHAFRPDDLDRLPATVTAHVVAPTGTQLAVTAAALVRIGQFDTEAVARLRAFYAPPLTTTLRVQARAGRGQPGIAREVAARRTVAEHVPELAPALHDHGLTLRGRIAHLLEERVDGRHPRRSEVRGHLDDLLGKLQRLYAGVGTEHVPLREVVHPSFPQRWQRFVADDDVDRRLDAAVRALVTRDALLARSLRHGDPVRSNLLVSRAGAQLIDWEFARAGAIAADLAKLELEVDDPDAVIAAAAKAGIDRSPRDAFDLREQVALAHVEMLTWHDHRRARAAGVGRTDAYEGQTERRLERVATLLGLG